MTLTEQWDKDKLPEGDYYIKRRNGDFLCDTIDTSGVWHNSIDEDILEVLAPVPSYEEWQKVLNIDFNNEVLRLENAKLKELLKECRDYVVNTLIELKNGYCYEENDYYHETKTLLNKIDNTIGEKK